MQTITITQRDNPVYNESGYLVGYGNKKSARYVVTKSQLNEILSIENNSINVHIVATGKSNAHKSKPKKVWVNQKSKPAKMIQA